MTRAAALLAGFVFAICSVGAQQDAFEVASVNPMGGDAPGEALAAFGSGCGGSFPGLVIDAIERPTEN